MAFPTIGLAAIMDVGDFAKGGKVYSTGLEKMNKQTDTIAKRITKAIGGIGKAALGAGITAGAALAGLGATMIKLAIDAAPVPAIAQSFTALGGSIEDLRRGSLGLVTDVELMKSFNTAAALVSRDFAQKLPEAMRALGKVAASTGQDMGFLLNSLTTGVGRLSPMILDNLAIQVDLAQAYEDFAAANGVTVKAMTKTQQQTAVMNQVMAKLHENTAALPEVTGTAAQQFGSLSTIFQNLKTDIGVAFLPVLQQLLTPLTRLAIRIGPQVIEWVRALALHIQSRVIPAITQFVARIRSDFIPTILHFVDRIRFDVIPVVTTFINQLIEAVRIGNWALIGQWIGTQLNKAVQIATDWFNRNVMPAAQELGERIRNWAVKAAAWVGTNTGPMLESLRNTLSQWIDKAVRWFVDNVVQAANEFGEKIRDWVIAAADWVGKNAGPMLTSLRETIGSWIDAAVDWFATNIAPQAQAFGEKVRDWISATATWVKNNWGDIVANAGEMLRAWVAAVVEWYKTNVVPVANTLGEKIRDWIEKSIAWVDSRTSELGVTLGEVLQKVSTQAATWFENTLQPRVQQLGSTFILMITRSISRAEEMLPEASVSFGMRLVQFISDANATVQRHIPTIATEIGTTLGNLLRAAIGFFAESGTFTQMRDEMFLNIWKGIVAGSAESPSLVLAGHIALTKAITSMWNAFLATVTGDPSYSTTLSDWLSGVLNTALETIKKAVAAAWAGLGGDMISGFLSGAVKKWDEEVAPKIDKLISGLPQIVKDILKISSPSQVFAELGIEMMIGLGKGITEGEAQVIKKLTKAIGRIVNAFRQLVELQRDFDLAGGQLPDIGNFLDQFEAAIVAVLERLDTIIERVGEKRIKKIRKSAKRLREILDAVMIDLSKIATATLPDLGRWRDQVIDVTRAVLEVLGHLAYEFGTQAIQDAAAWAGSVSDILAIVGPAVEALASLTEFSAIANLPRLAETFANQVLTLVDKLALVRQQYGTKLKEDAVAWWNAAKSVIEIVKPGIEALAALLDFEPVGNLVDKAANFARRLKEVVGQFAKAAANVTFKLTEEAITFWNSVQAIIGFVSPGISALAELLAFEPVGNLVAKAANFARRLKEVAGQFQKAVTATTVTITEEAITFWTSVQNIVGFVGPGVTALNELLAFEPVGNLVAKAANLARRLKEVAGQFQKIAEISAIELTEDAQTFWSAVQSIVGVVKPGIEALKAMLEFKPINDLRALVENFGMRLSEVVEELDAQASTWTIDVSEDAQKFFTAATNALSVVRPGIDAITALLDYDPIGDLPTKLATFVANISEVVTALDGLSTSLTLDTSEDAMKFWAAFRDIAATGKAGIDLLESLMDYRAREIKDKLTLFKRQINEVVTALAEVATTAADAVQDALTFRGSAQAIAAAIQTGIDLLSGLEEGTGTTGTSILTGLGNSIRDGLANALAAITAGLNAITNAFVTNLPAGMEAAWNYGYSVGRRTAEGFVFGVNSVTPPTFPFGSATPRTGASGAAATTSQTVNVNITGTQITNGMTAAAFNASVQQIVTQALQNA